MIQKARSQGIRLLVYLDDFIILGSSLKECLENTRIVFQLLIELGFLVNQEKSSLKPSTSIEFLGFIIDTAEMKFFVPVLNGNVTGTHALGSSKSCPREPW